MTGLSKELSRAQARTNMQGNGGNRGASTVALSQVFARIAEKCDQMQLPSAIIQRAQHAYKITIENKPFKASKERFFIAACIIFACRDGGSDRTFGDLVQAMKVTKKEIFQAINAVKMAVGQDRAKNGSKAVSGMANMETSVTQQLGRFTNQLGLSQTINNAAKHIAVEAIKKTDIMGRSPTSVATGVLYFTTTLFQEGVTVKDIEDIGSTSQSTIKLYVVGLYVKAFTDAH